MSVQCYLILVSVIFLEYFAKLALMAHICNSTYLFGWYWEDLGSKTSLSNISWDPISKISRVKWTGSTTQMVEHLLCKCKTLCSNSSLTKKKIFYKIRKYLTTFDLYTHSVSNINKAQVQELQTSWAPDPETLPRSWRHTRLRKRIRESQNRTL
jgi:hypothetical protein